MAVLLCRWQERQGFSAVDSFFELLLSMKIRFELEDYFAADPLHLCYLWEVTIQYDSQNKVGGGRGRVPPIRSRADLQNPPLPLPRWVGSG